MHSLLIRALSVALSVGLYLALAILGGGGLEAFFSNPARTALVVVTLALGVASLFVGGNLSAGLREDRGNRWVILAFLIIGLLGAYLPAWADREGVWILDGDSIRWLGVVLVAAGGALRLWPVAVLGRRFSGLVAIQPGHELVTTGLYSRIRHPSYLGLLITALGWGLAFNTAVGVLLALLNIPPLIARMNAEERLLSSEFGAAYDAYRAHTARLIPGVY
ncbi:MAG: isoprenylcysteine carboxylmethyltransferase family protein [Alphaproteobacteria bacterium]|nr:isoprenylcysteine carboxylmethyltransferase family protein [Alphaproteobacteria bacterium]MBM3640798.1 isoprenylcysteine carboxylmethyltransferase family protein [Alphaproteobacteria bacterium]